VHSKDLFKSADLTLGYKLSRFLSSPSWSSPLWDPHHPSCAPHHFDDNTKLRLEKSQCNHWFRHLWVPARSSYCPLPWGCIRPSSQEGETPRPGSLGQIRKGIWIGKINSHTTGWKLRLIDPQDIFEMQDNSVKPGDSVIVVDDMIATGKFTSGSWEYMFWIMNPRQVSQSCRWAHEETGRQDTRISICDWTPFS